MQMQQCPHCGAAIPATDRFCSECGRPVDAVPAQPVQPAPPAPPAQPLQDTPAPAMPAWQPPQAQPPAIAPQASPLAASTGGAATTQNLLSRENLSIATLVLGVINLCAWFLPICGIPLALLGIGLGVYSMNSRNRTLAIIGLALCALGLLASIVNAALGVANALR